MMNTVKIDANGIVRPINEGTVFLSEEINEKVHITEVNVSSSETKLIASPRMAAVATEQIETTTKYLWIQVMEELMMEQVGLDI